MLPPDWASDPDKTFCEVDFLSLSHRGLNLELIPQWLRAGEPDLNGRIESSAYGRTDHDTAAELIKLLQLGPDDVLLDLGAANGELLSHLQKAYGVAARGIEQNPTLVRYGHDLLEKLDLQPDSLVQGDFLTCDWPHATRAYATTSRFSKSTLSRLAERLEAASSITRVVSLGRELPLSGWSLESRSKRKVRWNPGEELLIETLCCWAR